MDTDILNPFEQDYQTDDILSPRVVAFVNEVQSTRTTRDDAWRLHHVLKGQRLHLTPGWTLETLDTVSIYAQVPVPEGHDHSEVHDFIARCVQAIERFERYDGSADNKLDNRVEGVIALRSGRNTSDECNAAREALPETLKEEGLSRGDLRIRVKAEMDAQALASIQGRLGVSAGQEDLSDSEDTSTAGQNALTCKNEAERKLAAEGHKDPRSQDWKDSPTGAWTLYEYTLSLAIKRGGYLLGRVHISEIPESLNRPRCMGWLVSQGLVVLRDGELLFMPDPEPPYDPDERYMHWGGKEIDLWEYEGWTQEQGNPLAGRTWGRDLDDHLDEAMARQPGLSDRQYCRILQHSVDHEDHRAVSVKAVYRARKRLEKDGRIVLVAYADRFRREHRWVNIPARYTTPSQRLTMRAVQERVKTRQADTASLSQTA